MRVAAAVCRPALDIVGQKPAGAAKKQRHIALGAALARTHHRGDQRRDGTAQQACPTRGICRGQSAWTNETSPPYHGAHRSSPF
jgi:hypothetical protein